MGCVKGNIYIFILLTGTGLMGLEGGVPNGDPGLFSLLASEYKKTTNHRMI